MPYLDLSEYDNYAHLIQLFLAAHPRYRQDNHDMREHLAMPGTYFCTLEMARDLAAWGSGRRLITRTDAARLVEVVEWLLATPADLVTLVPRVLGDPPRVQLTVLDVQLLHFVTSHRPRLAGSDPVRAFTIPAAIRLVQAMATDPEFSEGQQARALALMAWLTEQGQEGGH
jgi:hypothetical protein